jgi:methylmalonyl-CoA mutase
LTILHEYAIDKKFDVGTLTGGIFRNDLFENVDTLKLFASWNNFHPLGIEITKKESAAEEIGSALAQAVKQIDFLTDKGISSKQVLEAHAFHINIGEDFFLTIAKLKVLRMLWHNVAIQFGNQSPVPIFIHAISTPWIRKEYQPNSNLIKSTTAALSAVLGGCDALTIIPEESNNLMMERVARNVTSVLREEAQLSRVADPTVGSYYLESLIDQLAEQAWKSFQKQVNA